MSFAVFIKRALAIFAAFGFASLFTAIMNADNALMADGLLALLPAAIVVVLLVRIARRTANVAVQSPRQTLP